MSVVKISNDLSGIGTIHQALVSLSYPESDLISIIDRNIRSILDGKAIKVTYSREGNCFHIEDVPATEMTDLTALYFLPKDKADEPSEL